MYDLLTRLFIGDKGEKGDKGDKGANSLTSWNPPGYPLTYIPPLFSRSSITSLSCVSELSSAFIVVTMDKDTIELF